MQVPKKISPRAPPESSGSLRDPETNHLSPHNPRLPHPIPHTPDNILAIMRLQTILLPLVSLATLATAAEVTTEYTLTNTCTRKTQRGDSIEVHYRGTLESDGSVFDTSYKRGQPLSFTVGKGMVIKG